MRKNEAGTAAFIKESPINRYVTNKTIKYKIDDFMQFTDPIL